MKTATSLTLVAIGAILAFAVNAHMAFLNFHVVGGILILTGVGGAIIPRSSIWLRRTRTRVATSSTATAAGGPGRRPQPSPRPAPRAQAAPASDATPAGGEAVKTTKEYASA
jgi:hypothetical protein